MDLAKIDAFLAYHHSKESPVIAILVDVYDTFDRTCKNSGARIVFCTPAIYVWLVSHLFIKKVGPPVHYKLNVYAPIKERQIGSNSWLVW